MKTIKWLKISIVLQSIYIFSCIFSTICFAINRYFGIYKFFSLGMLAIPGWMLNPTGILTIALGLSFYFSEKSNENLKKTSVRNGFGLSYFLSSTHFCISLVVE